jgi:Transposase DDE domain group 1
MSNDTLLPFDLPSVGRKKLTIDFAGGNQSSDGGLLLLRAAERKLGVCRWLAEAMPDRRDPERHQPLGIRYPSCTQHISRHSRQIMPSRKCADLSSSWRALPPLGAQRLLA